MTAKSARTESRQSLHLRTLGTDYPALASCLTTAELDALVRLPAHQREPLIDDALAGKPVEIISRLAHVLLHEKRSPASIESQIKSYYRLSRKDRIRFLSAVRNIHSGEPLTMLDGESGDLVLNGGELRLSLPVLFADENDDGGNWLRLHDPEAAELFDGRTELRPPSENGRHVHRRSSTGDAFKLSRADQNIAAYLRPPIFEKENA